MDAHNLIEICKKHKLEIQTDTTPYGTRILVYIDDKKIDNQVEYSDLLEWSYSVLNETIVNQLEILDSYNCNVIIKEDTLKFDFEFNNSWEYEGSYGEDKVTLNELLPYLPDFINGFEEFKNLSLEEESLFCSFTYEKKTINTLKLEIHDIWSEGETEISFLSCVDLIESLKQELIESIELKFSGHDELWICSEDGTEISLLSTYNKEFWYEDLFG